MINYIKEDGLFEEFDPSKPLNPKEFETPRVVRVACKGPVEPKGSARVEKDSFVKRVLATITLKKVRKDDVCVR